MLRIITASTLQKPYIHYLPSLAAAFQLDAARGCLAKLASHAAEQGQSWNFKKEPPHSDPRGSMYPIIGYLGFG